MGVDGEVVALATKELRGLVRGRFFLEGGGGIVHTLGGKSP